MNLFQASPYWGGDAKAKSKVRSKNLSSVVSNKNDLRCERCSSKFSSEVILKAHYKVAHREFDVPKPEEHKKCKESANSIKCEPELLKLELDLFEDYLGDQLFPDASTRDVPDISETSVPAPKVKRNAPKEKKKKQYKSFVCELCGFKAGLEDTLQAHMLSKHEGKEAPFKCDKCDRRFFAERHLGMHVKRVHIAKRNNICPFCGQGFKDTNSFKGHVQRKHQSPEQRTCKVCKIEFPLMVKLYNHVRDDHPNELTDFDMSFIFPCVHCEKVYGSKEARYLHYNTAHCKKDFPCLTCGNSFKSEKSLEGHMRVVGHRLV